MIVVIEVIRSVPGKSEELKKVLHEMAPICRKGKGCIQYELFEPVAGTGEFLVLQKWQDKTDLTSHETSKYIENFIKKYDGVLYSEVTQYTEWKPILAIPGRNI